MNNNNNTNPTSSLTTTTTTTATKTKTSKTKGEQGEEPIPDDNRTKTSSSPSAAINTNKNSSSLLTQKLNSSTSSTASYSSTSIADSSSSISRFQPISPINLIGLLIKDDQTLILDIRPSIEHHHLKIKNSIGLNLPTTLLKRPLHGLDRIEASLECSADKVRFGRYKTRLPTTTSPPPPSSDPSSFNLNRVVVLDSDSNPSNPNPNHPLILLLKKFQLVGFLGDLLWLSGGFQEFSKTIGSAQWLVKGTEDAKPTQNGTSLRMSLSMPPSMIRPFISSSSSLSSSSTPPSPQPPPPSSSSSSSSSLPKNHSKQASVSSFPITKLPGHRSAHSTSTLKRHQLVFQLNQNPDSSTTSVQSSHLTTPISELTTEPNERPSLSSPSSRSIMKKPSAKRNEQGWSNPFFDNIRQLNERLSLDASLKNLSPLELPEFENPRRDLSLLPEFLRSLILNDPIGRARLIAHQFYDLEMAEQRRLQDVMRWHSCQRTQLSSTSSLSSQSSSSTGKNKLTPTTINQSSSPFQKVIDRSSVGEGGVLDGMDHHPFSISAGVELGYKNRYKNIWPWEHTRIKLSEGQSKKNGTDYINASLISFRDEGGPMMSEKDREDLRKKYIATQGPLGSTFDDFWSMVKEEDVGVIVMLTRRHEAGREKCGDYLKNGTYGDLVIRIESDPQSSTGNNRGDAEQGNDEDSVDEERKRLGDFFGFGASSSNPLQRKASLTNRKASLSDKRSNGVTKKLIKLSISNRPDLPPREIRHLQYRKWPDFDVPPLMEELIELSDQTHNESEAVIDLNMESIKNHLSSYSKDENRDSLERLINLIGVGKGPIVVHCSAGIGRTGSFIIVDVMKKVLKVKYIKPQLSKVSGGSSSSSPSSMGLLSKIGQKLKSGLDGGRLETEGNQKSNCEMSFDPEPNCDGSSFFENRPGNLEKERNVEPSSSDTPMIINSNNDQRNKLLENKRSQEYDDNKEECDGECFKDKNSKTNYGRNSGDHHHRHSHNHNHNHHYHQDDDHQKRLKSDKKRRKELPQFLDSELCDFRAEGGGSEEVSPMWSASPVMALVNEMREQRMSMVANYRQYVFVYEVLLNYLIRELKIKVKK